MKIKTFKELREAAFKVKAVKFQLTTKDHESDELKARTDGEQNFIDSHGLEKVVHPVAPEDQFTSNKKQASHTSSGENPIMQGSSQTKDKQKTVSKAKTDDNSNQEKLQKIRVKEEVEIVEMNEDVISSLKNLASGNKSGTIKFKNGETGSVNSSAANKIVSVYNKLTPENAKKMKDQMNKDVVGFMKVMRFADKNV